MGQLFGPMSMGVIVEISSNDRSILLIPIAYTDLTR